LDRAALPFSSHQQIAELPRTAKPQVGGQSLREKLYQLTRQALEIRAGPRLNTLLKGLRRLVRRAKRLRVLRMIVREFLPKGRPFQSLSEISRTKSSDYYRQCRSYEPKSS
jgi:hypothetical protein